jgi:hypothetical protein
MRDDLVRREGHKLHRDGLNNLRRMFLPILLAQWSEGVARTYEGTSTEQYVIYRLCQLTPDGQEVRVSQRRPLPQYCSVIQQGGDPSTSRRSLRCLLAGRTLTTSCIRDSEHLPILLRSLRVSSIQISDRPKIHGFATYRNDMR